MPCREARVNGYLLPDCARILVLITGNNSCSIALNLDMATWLSSPSGHYGITAFDEPAAPTPPALKLKPLGRKPTRLLASNELALFEIAPAK